jgi:uncharacterized membrane protein
VFNLLNDVGPQSAGAIVFYFTVYSFFGWIIENSYSLLTGEGFFKANFLKGPFKPMYGFAPVLLLLFISKHTHWAVIMSLCFLIPTAVEYLSGVMLSKLFNRQYWDYSNIPLQLHGHICLPFSLCWVILSFICLRWIHPGISTIYHNAEPYWGWIYSAVIFYFIAELIMAIRRHSLHAVPADKPTNPI